MLNLYTAPNILPLENFPRPEINQISTTFFIRSILQLSESDRKFKSEKLHDSG